MAEETKQTRRERPSDRAAENRRTCRRVAVRLRSTVRQTGRSAEEAFKDLAHLAVDQAQANTSRAAATARLALDAPTAREAAEVIGRRARTAPRRHCRQAAELGRLGARGALRTVRRLNAGLGRTLDELLDMRIV